MQVALAFNCHDREILAHVAVPRDLRAIDIRALMTHGVTARFSVDARAASTIPGADDDGSPFTALETISTAERLHLVPVSTPPTSSQSNGMSEAFVNTLRRAYQVGAELSTAANVLARIPAWIANYNAVARRTRHSTTSHPSSTGEARSPHDSLANRNCLTKRGTGHDLLRCVC